MEQLSERDVNCALDVVAAASGTQDSNGPFALGAVDALAEAIPADDVAYLEWRFGTRDWVTVSRSAADSTLEEAVEATCMSYPLRDRDHQGSAMPLKISDFISLSAWRRTPFYGAVMRPLGLEHELKLFLPAPPGEARYFSFARARGRDFDERDRALLSLLRPYLDRFRQGWDKRGCGGGLTNRELGVLELVADGLTNREVALALFISPATVRTHLEHIYEKLGARTRTGAVTAAFRRGS